MPAAPGDLARSCLLCLVGCFGGGGREEGRSAGGGSGGRRMKPVVGTVVSNKMQKSVVVAVDRLFHNKLYDRYLKRTSKFMAHDEENHCNIGDKVRGSPRNLTA